MTTGVGAVINTAKVQAGDKVVVFGLGGIGLNVIQGARLAGAGMIAGIDLNPARETISLRTVAADVLNVTVSTIADWCNAGRLECVRACPRGPRWITLTPEIITELRKPMQQHWKRRITSQQKQNMVQ